MTRVKEWMKLSVGYRSIRSVPLARSSLKRMRKPLTSGFVFALLILSSWTIKATETNNKIVAKEQQPTAKTTGHHPRTKTYMKRKWGVEVLFVRQTAAGYMLEFRYKVLDAEKAKSLFERQTKPILIHPRTGAELVVPTPAKTGALRNSNPPLVDHTYWMFFANPGKLVKVGEIVNVKIGDFLAKDIVVQ